MSGLSRGTVSYRIQNINIQNRCTTRFEIGVLQKSETLSLHRECCPIHGEQLTSSPYENLENDFCAKCEAEWVKQWISIPLRSEAPVS
jgi:hypothetical protein